MGAKYTIEDMKQIAKERDGECLSSEYKGVDTKLIWKCAQNHTWENTPYHIMKGQWCGICRRKQAGLKKMDTIENMRKLAGIKGGQCLSNEYKGDTSKLLWKCSEGHTWETAPGNIKSGCWCPICSGVPRDKKLNLVRMQKLAEKRGGKCLSEKYVNRNTKMKWQCANGHIWETEPRFVFEGRWCKECFNDSRRDTIERMRAIAHERGGECLSKEYVNQTVHLTWKCSNGHEWDATPANVSNGKWRPTCAIENHTGENNNMWKGGITPLSNYLRNYMKKWKKESLEKHGAKCIITNLDKGTIHIHHVKHFNVIRDEILNKYHIPLYHTINEYEPEMLDFIIEKLKEKHDEIIGVPIRKELHILFHKIYGKEDTTLEDLMKFKQRFLSGEFDMVEIKSKPISLLL